MCSCMRTICTRDSCITKHSRSPLGEYLFTQALPPDCHAHEDTRSQPPQAYILGPPGGGALFSRIFKNSEKKKKEKVYKMTLSLSVLDLDHIRYSTASAAWVSTSLLLRDYVVSWCCAGTKKGGFQWEGIYYENMGKYGVFLDTFFFTMHFFLPHFLSPHLRSAHSHEVLSDGHATYFEHFARTHLVEKLCPRRIAPF